MSGKWPLNGNQSDEQLKTNVFLGRDKEKGSLAYSRQDMGQGRGRKKLLTVRKLTENETENQRKKLSCPGFVTHSKTKV